MVDDDVLSLAIEEAQVPQVYVSREEGLSKLSRLAQSLRAKEGELESLESAVKAKKAEIQAITHKEMPELLSDLKMSSFEFEDGSKVTMKRDFAIAIKEENRERAYDWCEKNGHEGIIKVSVTVGFGKGEFEAAKALVEKMRPLTNKEIEINRSIHAQTLKAWAKEVRTDAERMRDHQQEVPPSMRLPLVEDGGPFTIFEYTLVDVKEPKRPKR